VQIILHYPLLCDMMNRHLGDTGINLFLPIYLTRTCSEKLSSVFHTFCMSTKPVFR